MVYIVDTPRFTDREAPSTLARHTLVHPWLHFGHTAPSSFAAAHAHLLLRP
jgi:hypothetical protein